MGTLQASSYASTYEIVQESTPPVWLSLRGLESDPLFHDYIQNVLTRHFLLSEYRPEWGLVVDEPDEPELFVSTEESALFRRILFSSVKVIGN